MKLSVTQENLSKALNAVGRVAGAKTTLPILSNILLKTTKNRVQLSATNLEVAITQFIGGKVDSDGAITVPAKLMSDFIISLPNEIINIELSNNKLKIKNKHYQSTINGMAAEDFPTLPKLSSKQEFTIPVSDLKKSLQQVVFAASTDEARPVLTGVYLHTEGGWLYAAATDSYRLAERRVVKVSNNISCIVPTTTLQHLLRIITDVEDEAIKVVYDDAQILFKLTDTELISRLINGTYPEYRNLIPGKNETSFTINREEFINIAKVASLFARESAGSITLKVSQDDKDVSITSVASQVGENTSSASASVKGTGEVTLNSRYLLEALSVIDDEEVTFQFNGKVSPCVLQPANKKSVEYRHIIMPLKS